MVPKKKHTTQAFQDPVVGDQWNEIVISFEECQSDQPTWVSMIHSNCEADWER